MIENCWMFYSYKGGSGRSVASANVATALAKLGKRVLIVDMDFEAPGLHTIFRVEKTAKFAAGKGIQNYFRGTIPMEAVRDELVIDLVAEQHLGAPIDYLDDGAKLLYLPAARQAAVVPFSNEAELRVRMKDVLKELRGSENLDYIILDAASGVREAFTLSLDACARLLVFFRWTSQHVEGTIRFLNLLERLGNFDNELKRDYRLVASASPRPEDLDSLGDDALAGALRALKNKNEQLLEAECQGDGPLLHEIPEIMELKWRDSIYVREGEETEFDQLAKKLLRIS